MDIKSLFKPKYINISLKTQLKTGQVVKYKDLTPIVEYFMQSDKRRQEEMMSTKHKMFEEIKNARQQNQKKIQVKKLQSLQQKIGKRNRVRLIQIGCKENIQNFWNSRLDSFQENKKMDMSRKLKLHSQNLKRLEQLERNEESLLDEIKRAEHVECELQDLIENQKSMDGSKLDNLYFSKVLEINE